MKKYIVYISPSAEKDIKEIISYISDGLLNKKAALDHYNLFYDTIKSLEYLPARNPISSFTTLAERGLRIIRAGNYAFIYGITEEQSRVDVYRVIYSRSDIENNFDYHN